MNISKAFSVFALFSFFLTSLYESSSNFPMDFKGFVTPLIHITSPEHPLYDPNSTPDDRIRENARISEERERYLGLKIANKGVIDNSSPINSNFVVAFEIGSPPVKSYGVLDTGSDIIWQKCKPCSGCSAKDQIYDPSKSRTYGLLRCDSRFCSDRYGFSCGPKKSSCQYSTGYMDGTTSRGVVGTDSFQLQGILLHPGDLIPNAVFGCASEVKSQSNVHGIIGLRNTSISLPNQLYLHSSFSYCKGKRGTGGYFIMGSDAALVGDKTPLFTDINDFYQIDVIGMYVEGRYLYVGPETFRYDRHVRYSGVTVDCGTTFTMLHPSAYLIMTFEIDLRMVGHTSYKVDDYFRKCYNATSPGISIETLPSIQLHLANNVKLSFPNENIWIKYGSHSICLQIFEAKQDWTILGAELLNSYNVGFDLAGNSLWLSYTPNGCPY